MVKEISNKVKAEVLWEFPSYSPDISPIEHIWGWLKNEVNKDMPTSISALKKCIKKHWKRLDSDFYRTRRGEN